MIYLKIHKTDKGDLIAMCDEELIGRKFKEGKMILDLKTYSDFYSGDLMTKKQAIGALDVAAVYSANVVGKEAVEIVEEKGLIQEGEVKRVENVPFVQIYKIV